MIEKYIKAALKEEKADLVLKNATYVNVFSQKLQQGDIAIVNDRIVGISSHYEGKEEIDVSGKIVIPGLIDGHVHIESSMLTPSGFAYLVMPHGTTTIIADPHEIANVCGIKGIDFMIKDARKTPLEVHMQLPSCVPATPFETNGATLDDKVTEEVIKREDIFGLGEFMSYPDLLSCSPQAINKIESAHKAGKIIDGHAPSLSGDKLNGYLSSGISTDHESVTVKEMQEKIDKGMYCHLRVGSYTKSMELVKAVNQGNYHRVILCADDKHAQDIYDHGHLDDSLRKIVSAGLDPIMAVTLGTLNAANCYHLDYHGGIAPYYVADLVVVDNLKDFNVSMVFKNGKMVAKDGKPLFEINHDPLPKEVTNTIHIGEYSPDDFRITLKGKKAHVMVPSIDGVMTEDEVMEVKSKDGDVDLRGTDLLKLEVVERHHYTHNIGKGLLKGYGFKDGAIGISIAHDSHNIILLGDDNLSMKQAVDEMKRIGGGMVIVDKATHNISSLPLEVGGHMTKADPNTLVKKSRELLNLAYSKGVDRKRDAFFSLVFLSLAVIPHIRLVDRGLVDVDHFCFLPLEAD